MRGSSPPRPELHPRRPYARSVRILLAEEYTFKLLSQVSRVGAHRATTIRDTCSGPWRWRDFLSYKGRADHARISCPSIFTRLSDNAMLLRYLFEDLIHR
jgi:hypothetical protein